MCRSLYLYLYLYLYLSISPQTPVTQAGLLSFKHVVTFNMDEYVGVPKDHPQSYHHFMWTNFFKHIDIVPSNVHILDGNASDLNLECERYERCIEDHGCVRAWVGARQRKALMDRRKALGGSSQRLFSGPLPLRRISFSCDWVRRAVTSLLTPLISRSALCR